MAQDYNDEVESIDKGDSPDFISLNAELNLYDTEGNIQFDKDKQAVREYFIQHVNPNTVFFHNLQEKLDYLVEHNYYDKKVLDQYSFEDIKKLFKQAYAHKYRFSTFVGALKFYTQYTLKTRDNKRFLERYEDRVTMNALLLARGDVELASRLVDDIITNKIQPATPTFLNAGLVNRGELISCYLLNSQDNMESIAKTIANALQLSKRGGGVGINITNIREHGAPIKGVLGQSSGVIPVMKLLEDSFSYANQLGARQGAGAVYVSCHHPDVMRVLDSKRENADEKIRIKTLSVGIVVSDIAFRLAKEGKDMYQFSPYDVERVYGKPMSEISITDHYDEMVENPEISKKKISARNFFMTIAELQFQSGYPYLLMEDTANQFHYINGRVSFSNLCVSGDTELLTDKGYRKVEDLHDTQEDFDVVVDNRAKNMDLSSTGTSTVSSTKMFKTATDTQIYKVETHEGHTIRATEWHKFYVDRDGDLVKIPLSDVVEGDRLLVQGGENSSWGDIHEPDLAYIAGVMAADGTFYSGRNSKLGAAIFLYGAKEEFRDKVQESIHRVLEGRSDLVERQSTLTPEFTYAQMSDRWEIRSTPLGKLFAENGIGHENKVSIPDFVKGGDKETQTAFINGVWQMDGCVTGSKRSKVRSIELGSIHREFLSDMQKILLGLGIYTKIYVSKKEDSLRPLPNGNGGSKEYLTKKSWSLRASNKLDGSKLFDVVEWKKSSKDKWEEISSGDVRPNAYSTHKNRATVKSITEDGIEDVYDVTVEDGHSVIFNGIATGNCSEILQTTEHSTYNESGEYDQVGRDISCNLASLNVTNTMDGGNIGDTVNNAMYALTSVSDLSNVSVAPTIKRGNDMSHSVGLGVMDLAGFLGREKIRYGSDEALDFTNVFFAALRFHCLTASNDMAKKLGQTFHDFDKSGYKRTEGQQHSDALKNYTTGVWETHPHTDRISKMFSDYGQWFPTQQDWQELDDKIQQYGLYHAYTMAVAPNGSTSYVSNSTSSVHPIVSKVEVRKEAKMGRVYYPAPHMNNDNLDYYQDAYELGYKALIDTYAVAQKHVDQAMSLTLFFKSDATTRDVNKAYIYAFSKKSVKNEFGEVSLFDPRTSWKSGLIKTFYYLRVRSNALEGSAMEECVSCMV